ncbi:hypothetical protein ACEWPN_07110 [Yoonia sp. R2-816]
MSMGAAGNTAPDVMLTAQLDFPIRFQGQWEDAETGINYNRLPIAHGLCRFFVNPQPLGLMCALPCLPPKSALPVCHCHVSVVL